MHMKTFWCIIYHWLMPNAFKLLHAEYAKKYILVRLTPYKRFIKKLLAVNMFTIPAMYTILHMPTESAPNDKNY